MVKENMIGKSIRLSARTWQEISQQTHRLKLQKESEVIRMAIALGLAQLKERKQ